MAYDEDYICYDDSQLAVKGSFVKLITKYGICDGDLSPCKDGWILMIFASLQIAFGGIQVTYDGSKYLNRNKFSRFCRAS